MYITIFCDPNVKSLRLLHRLVLVSVRTQSLRYPPYCHDASAAPAPPPAKEKVPRMRCCRHDTLCRPSTCPNQRQEPIEYYCANIEHAPGLYKASLVSQDAPFSASSYGVWTPACAIQSMKRCFEAKATLRPSVRYNYTGPRYVVVVHLAVSGPFRYRLPRPSPFPDPSVRSLVGHEFESIFLSSIGDCILASESVWPESYFFGGISSPP